MSIVAPPAHFSPEAPDLTTTGSPTSRWLGLGSLVGLAILLVFAFVISPPDERVDPDTNLVIGMFDAVRLLYMHVPIVIMPYIAFTITAIGSAIVLWKGSVWWDIAAAAAAEVGVVFAALTLITGSIWARPTWGVWWEWGDVRLMTSLMLFLVYLGYVVYRRSVPDGQVRARRSAIIALIGMINLPLVNRSVEWWESRTLHQKSSIADGYLQDMTLFTLMIGLVVFGVIFAWMVLHRFRIGWLEYQIEAIGLADAIAERRAQAAAGAQVDRAVDHPGVDTAAPATTDYHQPGDRP